MKCRSCSIVSNSRKCDEVLHGAKANDMRVGSQLQVMMQVRAKHRIISLAITIAVAGVLTIMVRIDYLSVMKLQRLWF